jgi:hypothetical protein
LVGVILRVAVAVADTVAVRVFVGDCGMVVSLGVSVMLGVKVILGVSVIVAVGATTEIACTALDAFTMPTPHVVAAQALALESLGNAVRLLAPVKY